MYDLCILPWYCAAALPVSGSKVIQIATSIENTPVAFCPFIGLVLIQVIGLIIGGHPSGHHIIIKIIIIAIQSYPTSLHHAFSLKQ